MGKQLLARIIQVIESSPNFSRFENRDLRPVPQHAWVSSPNGPVSNLFITGISFALDTYCQFTTLVYAVFGRNDRSLLIPAGIIDQIIAFLLSQSIRLQAI
jgi:hypothetical protein